MHLAILPFVIGCGGTLVTGAAALALGVVTVKAGSEVVKAVKQTSSDDTKKTTT